ncbi:uncharacterized protein VICG_00062 [Vittaforma corneae ATCC 50505]|uniref:DNA replication complex GINS protein PSF1 n=1 Tax=Vittaforma corneae (strain ATCC 50505) TaxID=993615 RepID=L2GR02_VITCO|nr:uncharacterized protein VICG_00062 [Vittaforma corneae ATCC 50505]ELA42747.1 hypothetical protein VICG_00062 [Vittaforma corneae ATCC 50505]
MLSEGTCKDLLDEIKHNQFKKFNTAEVASLEREMAIVQSKIDDIKLRAEVNEITESLSINFALLKAYKDRLERIHKTYKLFRLKRIQDSYFSKENVVEFLAPHELEFYKNFSDAVGEYLADFKHLALTDRHPPLDFFVQILALEDCGVVLCGDEFVELKKDRIYFLKKSDIAHLLTKKLVKVI